MSTKENNEPLAYCPTCRKRCPLRWRENEPSPEISVSTEKPSDAVQQPDDIFPVPKENDEPLVECDLLGNEIESLSRKVLRQSISPNSTPRPPLPKLEEWFECAICGHPKPQLEFVSLSEAVRSNSQCDSKCTMETGVRNVEQHFSTRLMRTFETDDIMELKQILQEEVDIMTEYFGDEWGEFWHCRMEFQGGMDFLRPIDWGRLLAQESQFAAFCPWEKLDGYAWSWLLGQQPSFADRCDWEKITGYGWSWLLILQPQFADHCFWEKLTGRAWSLLLQWQPQFAQRCPWEKINGCSWSRLLAEQPVFAAECRWEKLNGRAWSALLASEPQFAEYCRWEKLAWADWVKLLTFQPQFVDQFPWENNNYGYELGVVLSEYPQFADRCIWGNIDPPGWGVLLSKRPQFADHCPWERLEGTDWSYLLCYQPQFADRCPWEKLDGANWSELLAEQPEFADRCSWEKLDEDDWAYLNCEAPELAEFYRWQERKPRQVYRIVAPVGNAALEVVDANESLEIPIPEELIGEAEGIADMVKEFRSCIKPDDIISASGFLNSRCCGCIAGQYAGPLLFVFADSPYDISTLVKLVRRAMQIMLIECDLQGEDFRFPFAVIKNFETYSNLRTIRTKDNTVGMATSTFNQWAGLKHNYPELAGLPLFSCQDGRIVELILEEKPIIEKWINARNPLPRFIPISNIPAELRDKARKALQRELPHLISYWESSETLITNAKYAENAYEANCKLKSIKNSHLLSAEEREIIAGEMRDGVFYLGDSGESLLDAEK